MKSCILLLAASVLAAATPLEPALAALEMRDCTGNNCVRALRADSFPSRMVSSDCASFLRTIVTPATSTVFATATTPVTRTATFLTTTSTTTTPFSALLRRQQTVRPSVLPSYAAAACSVSSKYASACSCIGVTASTITVAAPVTTVTTTTSTSTSTTTATIVSTAVATAPVSIGPFYIRASGGTADGGVVSTYPIFANTLLSFEEGRAEQFFIDGNGFLRPLVPRAQDVAAGGSFVTYAASNVPSNAYVESVGAAAGNGRVPLDCFLEAVTRKLICGTVSASSPRGFAACGRAADGGVSFVLVGDGSSPVGCAYTTLSAVTSPV